MRVRDRALNSGQCIHYKPHEPVGAYRTHWCV